MTRFFRSWILSNPVNLITIARIPIGFAIYYFEVTHRITPALLLFLVGVVADTIDGPLSRKLGTASDRGKILDRICDGVFVFCTTAGVMVGGYAPTMVCVVGVGFALMSYIAEPNTNPQHHPYLMFLAGIRPIVYGAFFPALPMVVAWHYQDKQATFAVWGIAMTAGIVFLVTKRRRVMEFISPLLTKSSTN